MKTTLIGAALAAAALAAPVAAAPLSVHDLLTQYNAVSLGDLRSSQHIEGRVYVGGNLTGANISAAYAAPLPASSHPDIVVRGDATIGTLNGRGDVVIGGDASANVEPSGGPISVRVGGSFTGRDNTGSVDANQAGTAGFAESFPDVDADTIKATSAFLGGLSGQGFTASDPNNKAFDTLGNAVASEGAGWDAARVTVYHTTMAELASGGFSSNVASDETLIINVSGTSGNFGLNGLGDKSVSRNILFNFYEATDLNLNTAVWGSILAPFAHVTGFGGSTEGSVIAGSIHQNNGQIHLQPFGGDLPGMPQVPLPAGIVLLGTALLGIGAVRRFAA
ncbi:MAG: collagen-binding domain-containing protein [Pseudooceanicola sp.]